MKIFLVLSLGMLGLAFGAEVSGLDMIRMYSVLGAVVGVGIAALGGAIGMGHAAAATISGTARNPGISGKLLGTMFIALALIEAQVIYTLVLAIIALYSNPFLPNS
ncbi:MULTISPECIES: F0F1 ATP synthase subunit C [Helicobacter]|uniref:ATP synthase subunit c n=1 Tax=Helicobacter equorum TaxID=361872 RepID=A0A3D8IRT1_9HELI|nr:MULTISPECIES: F0F1 ATP synthase subunit C [Helicobacter]MBR2111929.1 F0F1 ATP synthase subunit C [Helicobacter sp.]MCI6313305.1 F0F1 ATP synthase subunit C [Helicobacter sp.]MCI7711379.1 F0F1 ATP synthase subunit C [Helicobacter sp.]MDD7345504.1 F0F1 ATP synthase subunit C [Helicobacter sp.]MDY2824096.1 F0F1 ATP synthase subunit C [Helicobacter sp.]